MPFIRSLSNFMALIASQNDQENQSKMREIDSLNVDSAQRIRYIRSLDKQEIGLPNVPKTKKRKWMQKKESISRFIDDLDYNNQIQSSFDLTLLGRQNERNKEDVA